jgi:mRNA degradation ribonuclease J1/J2
MYDVGQGESLLVSLPNDRGNVVIDCYNNVCDYLKKDGIKNIDLVFISHGHSDHMGAYQELVDNFKVKSTYSSYFDDTELLKELKKQYTPRLKKLTFSQGKLLIKLIDRQCNQTSYELIKTYMGGFKAGFYNAFASLFGASLKKEYDPELDDRLTERCILLIESGQM